MTNRNPEHGAACIFCRNNGMADECWHSVSYEPVARALAAAVHGPNPSDEQVGWFVDDAEEVAGDLLRMLAGDEPVAQQVDSPHHDLAAFVFNDRWVVTLMSDEMGSSMGDIVADLGTRVLPPAGGREQVTRDA